MRRAETFGNLTYVLMEPSDSLVAICRDKFPPSALPKFGEGIGGSRRALSEPAGRVAQPPDCFIKLREPRRGSADGAAFFGLLFLAAQEK
jgi:hypothetical protein